MQLARLVLGRDVAEMADLGASMVSVRTPSTRWIGCTSSSVTRRRARHHPAGGIADPAGHGNQGLLRGRPSNIEGANARPKVRIIAERLWQLTMTESSSVVFTGVREAHSLIYELGPEPELEPETETE